MRYTSIMGLLWLIYGCGNGDAHLHGRFKHGEKSCFMLSLPDMQEFITVEFDQKGFSAEGDGVMIKAGKRYSILLKSDCDGLECQTTVQRRYLEDKGQSFTQEEVWDFSQISQLVVEKRQLENVDNSQKFVYHRVNCPNQPKDSSLFDFVGYFSDGYATVSRGGRWGIVDSNFKISVPTSYDNMGDINDGTATFYDNNTELVGVVGVDNKIILPPQYKQASPFYGNRAAVVPQGSDKWGFVNRENKLVVAAQYAQINYYTGLKEVKPFSEGLANVAKDNLWGYIDTNGVEKIPFQYEHANGFKNGEAQVYYQNAWRYINMEGNCVKNCAENSPADPNRKDTLTSSPKIGN